MLGKSDFSISVLPTTSLLSSVVKLNVLKPFDIFFKKWLFTEWQERGDLAAMSH